MSIYNPGHGGALIVALPPCRKGTASAAAIVREHLRQRGGAQLAEPRIFLIVEADYPLPEQFLPWRLYHCLTGLVEGDFARGLAQYGAGTGSYAGWAALSMPRGTLSSGALADWLRAQVEAGVLPAGDGLLVFLFPGPDTCIAEPGFAYGVDFCAYHSALTPAEERAPAAALQPRLPSPTGAERGERPAPDSRPAGFLPYAVIPYPVGLACGQGLGLSDLEILTMLASHELAEAMTDAVPGQGWTTDDAPRLEIDDFPPCLWNPVAVEFDGWPYLIQAYWDEQAGACWQPPEKG